MSRLIVVSNRVSAPRDPAAGSTGGLAMALSAALRKYDGLWFGWSGETVEHFKLFATKNLSPLTPDEIDKALNPDYVPWRNFHTDLVQSVADAKGKSKSGAARWSVMHMNRKCSLKEKLCESCLRFV